MPALSDVWGLVLTSTVSLVVGALAHRAQLVSSMNSRKSARELAEAESFQSMISDLRAEIRELRQGILDTRELHHKSVLENQRLRHENVNTYFRLEKLQDKYAVLEKENAQLREELQTSVVGPPSVGEPLP